MSTECFSLWRVTDFPTGNYLIIQNWWNVKSANWMGWNASTYTVNVPNVLTSLSCKTGWPTWVWNLPKCLPPWTDRIKQPIPAITTTVTAVSGSRSAINSRRWKTSDVCWFRGTMMTSYVWVTSPELRKIMRILPAMNSFMTGSVPWEYWLRLLPVRISSRLANG